MDEAMSKTNSNISSARHMPKMERILGLAALILLGILCVLIVRPFAPALMWAVVLGIILYPAQKFLSRCFGGRNSLAAFAVTTSAVLLVLVPLGLLGLSLVDDAQKLGETVKEEVMEAPRSAPPWLGQLPFIGQDTNVIWRRIIEQRDEWMVRDGIQDGRSSEASGEGNADADPSEARIGEIDTTGEDGEIEDLRGAMAQIAEGLRKSLIWVAGIFAKGITQLVISLFLVFFILKDAPKLAARIQVATQRIAGARGQRLLKVAGQTVNGVIYGYLGTSAAQALLAGFGCFIAGVPGAVLLGALTFVLAVVPFGPVLIWGGAAIWLFTGGQVGWGIFMLIWGTFAISSIDNFLRPMLVSHGNKMPFALMFLGLIGGAVAFGLVGLFLGPAVLAVAFRLGEEWTREPFQRVTTNG